MSPVKKDSEGAFVRAVPKAEVCVNRWAIAVATGGETVRTFVWQPGAVWRGQQVRSFMEDGGA